MKTNIRRLHEDYNITKFGMNYSVEETQALKKLYEGNIQLVAEDQVVSGVIVGISKRDVIVNIGVKSDGLVSISEFRDTPDIKIGDQVEVYIAKQENNQGQLVLSRKQAKLMKMWEIIQDSAQKGTVIEAVVKKRNKGGLIVDIKGLEAFLPGSQIDVKPVRDFDIFLDKTIDVVVININSQNDNVIVSHKAVIEKSLEDQKTVILSNLVTGQVLEGIVKNVISFGVFVDLGGIDGLLHITDIVWHRINHPAEVLELGQKIQVVVTSFDEARKRISLGMKQLTPNPWEQLPEYIQLDAKVKGKIVNIADYGAFLEVFPGVEGLIHISEMSWSQQHKKVEDLLHVGDEVEAIVLSLDKQEKKMSLGLKQITPDPWKQESLEQKYAAGTKHAGMVKSITHFGALIELETGIEGLLHISDLSWTKKINHPTEMLQPDQKLLLTVLEFNQDNRRLALGLKQLEENPWEVYENVFQVGSVHPGTVIKKTDKGTVIQLHQDLEGLIPKRHFTKEHEPETALHQQIEVEVIEFSKPNRRIVLAHKKSTTGSTPGPKRSVDARSLHNFTTTQKSTLGDVAELAMLQKKLATTKRVEDSTRSPDKTQTTQKDQV